MSEEPKPERFIIDRADILKITPEFSVQWRAQMDSAIIRMITDMDRSSVPPKAELQQQQPVEQQGATSDMPESNYKIGDVVEFDDGKKEGLAVLFRINEELQHCSGIIIASKAGGLGWTLNPLNIPQEVRASIADRETFGGWNFKVEDIDGHHGNILIKTDAHAHAQEKLELKLDSLIMSEDKKSAIINLIKSGSSESRQKLYTDWGFDETIEKGKGLAMLFYGPPGTGKTKCAELIAKEIGYAFQLVDTATLWSSEPGATERKLKEIFKKATGEKTLLCFDECDSLIYDRNRVGMIISAEINCLLSELERYAGITVFTTNRTPKLDKAFQRRLQLKLEFDAPTAAERQKIWRALIPTKAPLHDDVCFKTLSMSDLSGGNIKNCVLNAARFAIQENAEKIEMKHLNEAVRLELNGLAAFADEDHREEVVRG